ncbi:DUF6192 family protein [Streptomyces sp. NPDC005917]|uniref:DUF6192 family protein n=1 Tax=unclassified Streptomyces TaxID=2593676 RepID=UPI0033F0AC39
MTDRHSFVAVADRTVLGLLDRTLSGTDERTIVQQNTAKVRATLDWIEQAVETGRGDTDDEFARLLKRA